jgi:hypothetical protein
MKSLILLLQLLLLVTEKKLVQNNCIGIYNIYIKFYIMTHRNDCIYLWDLHLLLYCINSDEVSDIFKGWIFARNFCTVNEMF